MDGYRCFVSVGGDTLVGMEVIGIGNSGVRGGAAGAQGAAWRC